MTVRTWITISALVLVALTGAVAYQFTRALSPPQILAHAGDLRLDGALGHSCWPQRSGKLDCTTHRETKMKVAHIPRSGSLRLVVAYPAQPKEGLIQIVGSKGSVLRTGWRRALRYRLAPGIYRLTAQARYPIHASVTYYFSLLVR